MFRDTSRFGREAGARTLYHSGIARCHGYGCGKVLALWHSLGAIRAIHRAVRTRLERPSHWHVPNGRQDVRSFPRSSHGGTNPFLSRTYGQQTPVPVWWPHRNIFCRLLMNPSGPWQGCSCTYRRATTYCAEGGSWRWCHQPNGIPCSSHSRHSHQSWGEATCC